MEEVMIYGGMTLIKKSKQIIILLSICSVLSTLLLSEINLLMNNIIAIHWNRWNGTV